MCGFAKQGGGSQEEGEWVNGGGLASSGSHCGKK